MLLLSLFNNEKNSVCAACVCVGAALVVDIGVVNAGLSVSTSLIFGLLCRAHPPTAAFLRYKMEIYSLFSTPTPF